MYSSLPCKLYYGVRTQLMYHNIKILQQNIFRKNKKKKGKKKEKKQTRSRQWRSENNGN